MVHYIVTTSGFSFFNFLLIDENQANKQFSQENCILGTAPNKYRGGGGKPNWYPGVGPWLKILHILRKLWLLLSDLKLILEEKTAKEKGEWQT